MQTAVRIVYLYLQSFTMHLHESVHRDVFDMLCRLPGFNAQMLSNAIWACATTGFADDAVFIEAAAQAAIQMGKHLREQVRAKTWSTAYFNCPAVMPECCLTTDLVPCLHPSITM